MDGCFFCWAETRHSICEDHFTEFHPDGKIEKSKLSINERKELRDNLKIRLLKKDFTSLRTLAKEMSEKYDIASRSILNLIYKLKLSDPDIIEKSRASCHKYGD